MRIHREKTTIDWVLSAGIGRRRSTSSRSAFTLLEVILAIALSVTLLALITVAIDMFLIRVDSGRSDVEQAQLVRNLLQMIASDVRNAAAYMPQDTSVAKELAAAAGSFDVDRISQSGSGQAGGGSGQAASGGGERGSSRSGGSSSGTGGSGGGSGSAGASATADYSETRPPLGVYGNLNELQIDTIEPVRPLEMVPTEAVGAQATAATLWSGGSKIVRYYVRMGNNANYASADLVAARLQGEDLSGVSGLVRVAIPRERWLWSQENGSPVDVEQSATLVAPEVRRIEFRYTDGVETYEMWDSFAQEGAIPRAIEIRIWVPAPEASSHDPRAAEALRSYMISVPLWHADLAAGSATGTTAGSGTSAGSMGTSGASQNGSSDFGGMR